MHLETITEKNISEIINNKQVLEIEIPDEVVKFKTSLDGVDFSIPREVPPTSIILTADGMATVLVHSGNGLTGIYQKLVVFTYAFGGKIHYTALANGNYKASFSWPNA